MSDKTKSVLIIGSIIVGSILLLYGLAKIGTKGSVNGSPTQSTPVTSSDWSKGPENARVTLVEYSDFQCPACGQYYPVIKRLGTEFPNDLRIIYRNFPLREIHKNAQLAAQAAEAAGKQGKFWDMHDMLFNTQDSWENSNDPADIFVSYAKSLSLNEEQFRNDMNSSEMKDRVNEDYDSGIKGNIQATPSFFINDEYIENPNSFEEFKAIIQAKLQ